MKYATAHSDKKRPKVAIFYQEDEFGKDGLRGIKEGAKFYDYEFVAAEPFKRGSMDFSSQAMNLKKAAPDIVYMSCIFPPAGSLMKETYRLGWKPQFVGCYVSNDPRIADVAGPAAKGLITTNMWARSNEKIPAIQNLRRLVKKYAPQMDNEKTLRDFSIMWSMANTMVMVEGLKKAGRQLTVESFIKGMESLHGYATGLMAPFYYGPNLRRGAAGYGRINKLDLEKKDFVPVTDWFKPKAIK